MSFHQCPRCFSSLEEKTRTLIPHAIYFLCPGPSRRPEDCPFHSNASPLLLCTKCDSPTHLFSALESFNCHHRKYHRKRTIGPTNKPRDLLTAQDAASFVADQEEGAALHPFDEEEQATDLPPSALIVPHEPLPTNFGSEPAYRFFHFHAQNNQGVKYLVSKCHSAQPVYLPDWICREDQRVIFLYNKIVNSIRRRHNHDLADLVHSVQKLTEDRMNARLAQALRPSDTSGTSSTTPSPSFINLPCTYNSIRSVFLEGKNSIRQNLPIPEIQMAGEFSYTPIRACIQDLLAKGYPLETEPGILLHHPKTFDPVRPVRRRIESWRFHEIIQAAREAYSGDDNPSDVVVCCVNDWSDEFEGFGGGGCSNRNPSIAFKTMTISPPHEHHNNVVYTYPLSVGPKGADREPVEKLFTEELNSLQECRMDGSNTFYHASTRQNVRVFAATFASLQDQPERRAVNHVLGGASLVHKRFGYSCNHAQLSTVLPACDDCHKALYHWIVSSPGDRISSSPPLKDDCPRCVNWNIISDSPLLDHNPPKKYPPSELEDGSETVRPFPVTYESLIAAVAKARERVKTGEWIATTAEAYLNLHTCNKALIERVLEPAKYEAIRTDGSIKSPYIDQLYVKSPEIFEDAALPALWNRTGVELQNHVEAYMHLLGLGIVKTIVLYLRKWLVCSQKLHNEFKRYAKCLLQTVPRIPWCLLQPFVGDKLGGWKSSDLLSFARVSKWFYAPMLHLSWKAEYDEPKKPLDSWFAKEIRGWFTSRGLDLKDILSLSDGLGLDEPTREELRKLVANHPNDVKLEKAPYTLLRLIVRAFKHPGHAHLIPSLLDRASLEDIELLIVSLHAMVAKVMQPVVTLQSITEVDALVKHFLNVFARVDKEMQNLKDKKPQWVDSYNFLCLLNIASMLARFGPPTLLWEGYNQGEAYVQHAKAQLDQGLRPGWQKLLLKKMWEASSRRYLEEQVEIGNKSSINGGNVELDGFEPDPPSDKVTINGCPPYKDLESLMVDFTKMKPICVLSGPHGHFGAILRGGRVVRLRQLKFHSLVFGMCYHVIQLDLLSIEEEVSADEWKCATSALLLPLLVERGEPFLAFNGQDSRHDDTKMKIVSCYACIDENWSELDKQGRMTQEHFFS